MIDPKALEELDLASRAIERARVLLSRDDPKAMEAARRILQERTGAVTRPSDTSFAGDAEKIARALLAKEGPVRMIDPMEAACIVDAALSHPSPPEGGKP